VSYYISIVWSVYPKISAVDERAEIIPFTSYFQANKVSITVPTEVTYHSTIAGAKPIKTIKTTWVNYYFEDEDGSYYTLGVWIHC
jgi:hypothetical protein